MSDKSDQSSLLQVLPQAPWLRRFPLRTPTLPPATHTNIYVIGTTELLVVDPASPYPDEQERLLQYLDALRQEGRRITALFLTHHHIDHVSGAAALLRHLEVPVLCHPLTAARVAGRVPGLVPLAEGDPLPVDIDLSVLHTPGHAPGHLCLVDACGNAVVGDMVASTGTIVIDPEDDGDMGQYLDQLARLRGLGPLRLWPAHGAAVEAEVDLLGHYIAHRRLREHKVLSALQQGPAPLAALVKLAYDDVPEAIHPLALRSLLAHLHKLRGEGQADERAGVWHLA